MEKVLSVINDELRKKAWNSILQLILGGSLIYLMSVTVGPTYGCGNGNTQLMKGMFQCSHGEMQPSYKMLIIGGIVLASLCWGRAANLYEKRRGTE